jgi:hypothetical protein
MWKIKMKSRNAYSARIPHGVPRPGHYQTLQKNFAQQKTQSEDWAEHKMGTILTDVFLNKFINLN